MLHDLYGIWADRKPAERKGVLLLTIFPVVTFLVGHRIYGLIIGHYALASLPVAALQVLLFGFFGFSYLVNRE